jgi:hypothetical protein
MRVVIGDEGRRIIAVICSHFRLQGPNRGPPLALRVRFRNWLLDPGLEWLEEWGWLYLYASRPRPISPVHSKNSCIHSGRYNEQCRLISGTPVISRTTRPKSKYVGTLHWGLVWHMSLLAWPQATVCRPIHPGVGKDRESTPGSALTSDTLRFLRRLGCTALTLSQMLPA